MCYSSTQMVHKTVTYKINYFWRAKIVIYDQIYSFHTHISFKSSSQFINIQNRWINAMEVPLYYHPWRNVIVILYTTIPLIFLHSTFFIIRCDHLIGLTFTFPPPARCFAFAIDPTLEVVFHSSFRFSIYSVRGIYMEMKRDLLRNQYNNIES